MSNGTISVRYHKSGNGRRPFKFIRIAPGKWALYHVQVWKEHFGPVPHGKIIVFKDGDSLNCTPENLEAITKAQAMERTRQSDEFIACRLASLGRGMVDREKYELYLQDKALLEAKRQQLKLNQKLKLNETKN